MKIKFFFLLLLSLYIVNCTLSIEVQATIRYVSKTGASTPPYTSWLTAADSIQKCVNICSFGDTVYVANGIYKEQVVIIPGLSLIGGGIDSCAIDTRELTLTEEFFSVRLSTNGFITGFNIYTYDIDNGSGIRVDGGADTKVIQCKIQISNIGIACFSNNIQNYPLASKNIINNVQDGIICEGKPLITENIISANLTGLTSQINSSPTYINNLIIADPCYEGFNDALGFKSVLKGNLFYGRGRYTIWSYGTDSIVNNIIYGHNGVWDEGITGVGSKATNNHIQNTLTALYYDQPGGSPQTFKYNNLWQNQNNSAYISIDSTNTHKDPMFVNADSMDFHLQKYSPLIDAGDPSILDKDSSRSDIGIYGGPYGESYKYLDLSPRAPINLTALIDSNYITLNWNRNAEADTSFYNVYRDTVINFTIDSTKLVSSSSDTFYVQINPHNVSKYVYKVTCVDKQGNESEPSEEKVVNITSVSIDDYPMTISDYRLYQNYPNPFNPSTTISYRLKERGYVKLYVYDIKGELINILVNKTQEAGFYETKFNVAQESLPAIASGIYIYQIMIRSEKDIPVFTDIKKMLIIK